MDPANALVLLLCTGGVALLVWFEINSRRNNASRKQASSAAQPDAAGVRKQDPHTAQSEIDKTKAA